jgi:LPXTG-motif cell wall-anchored protein
MRFKKSFFLGLTCLVMLAVAAPAWAEDPAQNAYDKFSQFNGTSSSTLPFTGINVGAVALIGLLLVAAGFVVRSRTRARLSD